VADWSGLDGASTVARYRSFAKHAEPASPSYAVLCRGVAGDAELLALLDALPTPKRQPNLLLGAVRYLGGPVADFPAFRQFVLDRWPELSATMLARRTQTNEPRRCTALLPVLAGLTGPLALLEIGASAGLCLQPDRYAYVYAGEAGEHRIGPGPVELRTRTRGPLPLPTRMPDVVWRAGLDLHPLDIGDDDTVRWLECLIWPEQTDRFAVLSGAVALARADPIRVVAGDLRTDLPALAAAAPPGATLVVYHSAALAYVAEADRAGFAATVLKVAADRPTGTVWIGNEAPGVVPGSELAAPGKTGFVLTVDRTPVAHTGPHGEFVHWLN
jgi:hypothetical protein